MQHGGDGVGGASSGRSPPLEPQATESSSPLEKGPWRKGLVIQRQLLARSGSAGAQEFTPLPLRGLLV